MIKTKPAKNDTIFDAELSSIVDSRWYNRKKLRLYPEINRPKPISKALVQRKIVKHPLFSNIKADLMTFKFEEERNG